MDQLKESIDTMVSVGIRAYIGLLGFGERERSSRLFKDTMAISSLVAGGPSARISPVFFASEPHQSGGSQSGPLVRGMLFATLRSLLATLLVLKASPFWNRLPELERLHEHCVAVAGLLEELSGDQRAESPAPECAGERPSGCACERSSGATAPLPNSSSTHETGTVCGCRRNNALPTVPELISPEADCSIIEQYTTQG